MMSKRKRMTGTAEEMRQIAQVLRQNDLPEQAVKAALLAMCGVHVMMSDKALSFYSLMESVFGEDMDKA